MEKEFDLFKFDESFVAKIVAQGKHGVTIKDAGGRIRTLWGGQADKIYKDK